MDENLNNENKKTLLEIEREELNLLVQRGVKFDISMKVKKRVKGLPGFLGKKEITEKTETFEIHEPTLSVLDRISDVALDMVINDDELCDGSQEFITRARKIVKGNSEKLARVIAIAVLGEDYHINEISKSGKIKRLINEEELNRLTDLFFHSIKPSKLSALASTVTNISNFADFLVSMRLLSGARMTQQRKESIE